MLVLNGISALASAYFGIVALVAPGALPGINDGVTDTAKFFADMYAVRALPIAAVLLWLVACGWRQHRPGLIPVLLVAGISQFGDATIGIAAGTASMIVGAAFATIVHLGSAWWLGRPAAPR
ncbi:hypothetical protein Ahu01nite_059310 [Winogradskya humida]|uniref:Uncharacterized protein n=2 Tax=Winogradskya humida TaxID=113566 RepID=A0ABQ3ZW75_9ACTN|nr:hypothetical protein Ahu01nite_059310 [Actinoplanes humidus]